MKDNIWYSIKIENRDALMFLHQCGSCGKEYESHVILAAYTDIVCVECRQCSNLAWYNTAIDPVWDKGIQLGKDSSIIKKEVENHLPSCNKCGGKFEHIDWYNYGAPIRCPFCKINQKEIGSLFENREREYDISPHKFKKEREKYNELVYKLQMD